jgi:microcystin-dependent protein
MKTKLLLLSILMLFTVTINYAQASASFTEAGIAVQGIVRDNNNTALTDGDPITITFTLYYDDNGSEKTAHSENYQITPDAFGVFSHVIIYPAEKNPLFSNFNMKLKIETTINGQATAISNEPLKYVPYAISANNGVPTGAIMPFVGAENQVPLGWVLCDGQPLPSTATKLIAMVGTNTPNLGGMFLRGAGTNTNPNVNGKNFTGNDGPAVNQTQDDVANLKSHNHGVNLNTATDGAHTHTTMESLRSLQGDGGFGTYLGAFNPAIAGGNTIAAASDDSKHSHRVTGNTGSSGDNNETRPVNYGVNYIIKL